MNKTNPKDWIPVKEGSTRKLPVIRPVPYRPREGEMEDFDVCLSPLEVESVKDAYGDIRFEKVHEFLLPVIDGDKYYHWLAARMRNYMIFLIRTEGYTPRYYNPAKGKEILGHHVARYFGVEISRMLRGFPSVDETWSTRESLFEIGLCVESMPKAAMYDMSRCIHFTDDSEVEDEEDWDSVYPDKKGSPRTRPSIV